MPDAPYTWEDIQQQPVVGPTGEEAPAAPPPNWPAIGRTALELGGSLALTAAAPEIALPAQALRLLGPVAAKGIGHLLPKVMGSGAGAGAGSLAAETFDPTQPKFHGLPPEPFETAKEAAKLGAMGEAGGRALGGALQFATRPHLQPGALQAQRLLGERGASLTAGQGTKSGMVDFLENISESGFWPTKTQAIKEKGEQTANDLINEIVQGYASRGTTKELGGEVQAAVQSRIANWKNVGHQKYAELDQLLGQQPMVVDAREVIRRAQQLGQEAMLKDPQAAALITQIVGDPRRKVPGLSPNISFSDAQRLRSELLAIGGDPSELVKGRRQNYARLLADLLDTKMEQAGKSIKGNAAAYEKWREASAYWKGSQGGMGAGMLQDPVIVQLMEKDPGVVLDVLLRSGKAEGFGQAMGMLPPQVADGVRREFLERALSGATKAVEGSVENKLSGAMLAKRTGIASPYSPEAAAYKGLFGPKEAKSIEDAVQTLRLTQTRPTDQGFTFVVRGIQVGGAISALTMQTGRYGLGVTMIPSVAAWMIQNPVSRKLIMRAQGLPPNTPQWTAAMLKLVAFADRNGIPVTGGSNMLAAPSHTPPSNLALPQAPQFEMPQR